MQPRQPRLWLPSAARGHHEGTLQSCLCGRWVSVSADTSESTDAPSESTDAPSESTDAPSQSTDAPTTGSAASTSTAASSKSTASITTRHCKITPYVLYSWISWISCVHYSQHRLYLGGRKSHEKSSVLFSVFSKSLWFYKSSQETTSEESKILPPPPTAPLQPPPAPHRAPSTLPTWTWCTEGLGDV